MISPNHGYCFVGNGFVQILTVVVIYIDGTAALVSKAIITCNEQFDRFGCQFHTSRSIDARSDFENYITDGDFFVFQSAHFQYGFDARAGVGIDLFYPVKSQNAVFTSYWNNVRCNAQGDQIEQGNEILKINLIDNGKCLHQFEAYSAARKVFVGIVAVFAFSIEHGNGSRKNVVGIVVIADNEVNA